MSPVTTPIDRSIDNPPQEDLISLQTSSQSSLLEAHSSISSNDPSSRASELSPSLPADQQKTSWTYEEEQLLFQLHNRIGNKWSLIAEHFASKQKSDNNVKNHFYSKLRKALRKLNKIIQTHFKRQIKEIRQNVIYKIIEVTELSHKKNVNISINENFHNVQICMDLKNRLLEYSYDQSESSQAQSIDTGKQLIEEILAFSKEYRQVSKKPKTQLISEQTEVKKSKKSCLLRETKEFGMILVGSSKLDIFETFSNSPSHKQISTRNSLKHRNDTSLKNGSQISTPSVAQSSTCFNEQTESFYKDLNFLEDYSLSHFSLMAKQESSTFQNFDKMSDQEECSQFRIFQERYEEQQVASGMSSRDHFEDPQLDERKFSIFE